MLPALALYGANAAGKSNVLHALMTMKDMVIGDTAKISKGQKLPFEPFGNTTAPTSFEIVSMYRGIRYSIAGFMVDKSEWTGTATELVELLDCADLKSHVLTRKMNAGVSDLYNKFGVSYTQNERSRDKRTFTLRKEGSG